MHCGKSCGPQRIVDGELNVTMRIDTEEGSERIVAKEINARMRFGIWHWLQMRSGKSQSWPQRIVANAEC